MIVDLLRQAGESEPIHVRADEENFTRTVRSVAWLRNEEVSSSG
jgi:hypothetical protein